MVLVAARILDGAADKPRLGAPADGFRRVLRRVAEAALEVRGHREVCCLDDGACVRDRFIAGDLAIAAPEDARRRAAGSRERDEPEPGENARRASVPRVRNDERRRSLVELAKGRGVGRS